MCNFCKKVVIKCNRSVNSVCDMEIVCNFGNNHVIYCNRCVIFSLQVESYYNRLFDHYIVIYLTVM